MSIASKLEYLDGTKDYIRQCIQQKGVTVPAGTTFRQYGDKILEIKTEQHPDGWPGEGGGEGGTGKLTVGVATATGKDYILNPPEEYDGFSAVNVTGDYNLKPENIAEGITIYGVTGTMQVPRNTSTIPSAYLELFEEAKKQYDGDYKNLMILESDSTVAFGFMLDGFNVDNYDPENTEFYASKWVYVAYNKSTGTWKVEPWENSTSNGNSYVKNIRYCDTYIYYGDLLIYPMITINPIDPLTYEFKVELYSTSSYNRVDLYISGSSASKVIVDWGDGTVDEITPSSNPVYHSYPNQDRYVATFKGLMTGIQFGNYATKILTPYPNSFSIFEARYRYNQYITTLPSDLFSNIEHPILNLYQGFYAMTGLTSVPSGLFDPVCCRTVTSMNQCFDECSSLMSVPEDLLYNLENLTNIDYLFQYTKFEIPPKLFSKSKKIGMAQRVFAKTSITKVPAGLFSECSSLANLYGAFQECSQLFVVQGNIFPKTLTSEWINCAYMFRNCYMLTTIPSSFFNDIPDEVSTVEYMFAGCSNLAITVPEIWNEDKFGTKFTSIPHGGMFASCTKIINYDDIPLAWR